MYSREVRGACARACPEPTCSQLSMYTHALWGQRQGRDQAWPVLQAGGDSSPHNAPFVLGWSVAQKSALSIRVHGHLLMGTGEAWESGPGGSRDPPSVRLGSKPSSVPPVSRAGGGGLDIGGTYRQPETIFGVLGGLREDGRGQGFCH